MSPKFVHRFCQSFVSDFVFLEAKTCSEANFAYRGIYGKSPCFLHVAFLNVVSPDYWLLILPFIDGEEFLECAF